jgi:NADH dehydrogenase
MSTLLLVGATGRLGSRIARELLSKGLQVRALCRPTSGSGALRRMGAEIAIGDLREPASLAAACAGIDTVLTTANSARASGGDTIDAVDLKGTHDLIAAARGAGVRHFIYMSALTASEQSPAPFLAAKGRSETELRNSGMDWTIMAPNLFMESWVTQVVGVPVIAGAPVVIIGDGRTRHTFIAEHDVAGFTVAAVNNPAAVGRRIEVGGPEALSWRDVVATFERVLGRPVETRFAQPGDAGGALPPAVQPLLVAMDHFETAFDSAPLAREFGVTQTPLEPWVRAYLATARPKA